MNLFNKIKELFNSDPVYNCKVYTKIGCSHVDGLLCDFKTCSLRLEESIFSDEQILDIPYNLRFYKNDTNQG